MDEDGEVLTSADQGILRIGLSRTAKRNSLTPEMMAAISRALTCLDEDPDLRVGVLYGDGGHFTSGLDLLKFLPTMSEVNEASARPRIDALQLKAKCSKPLIAAVSGYVFTVGIELLLACDIAIAGDDSVFAQLETTRGIMISGGGTVRWIQRAGYGNAMRWMLTGERFDAIEALRIGLVQEVVLAADVLPRALAIAGSIAANAPLAVRETKISSLRYLADGEAAAFERLGATQASLMNSSDATEGAMAMMQKRSPQFTGQ